jgi:hypothetical protein
MAYISARRTDAPDRAAYVRRALVYRQGGSATIEGAVDTDLTRESDTAWDATITVSGNDARVTVTGTGTEVINWKSKHLLVESL